MKESHCVKIAFLKVGGNEMVAKKYIGRSVYIKNNEAMAICTLLVDAAIEQIEISLV